MVVVVVALGAVFWLSLTVATAIAGTPVGAGDLAQAFLGLTLLGLAIGSVTYAVSAATGRRQAGIAAGAGVGVLMYLLNTLAVMNETIRPFRYLSLFHYSGGASPLGKGLDVPGLVVLRGHVGRHAGAVPGALRAPRRARLAASPVRSRRDAPPSRGYHGADRHVGRTSRTLVSLDARASVLDADGLPPRGPREPRAASPADVLRRRGQPPPPQPTQSRISSMGRGGLRPAALRRRLSQPSRTSVEPHAGHTVACSGVSSSATSRAIPSVRENVSAHTEHT